MESNKKSQEWVVNAPDESLRIDSALRYEAQQRTLLDMSGKPIASLSGFGNKGKEKGKKGKGNNGQSDKGSKPSKGKETGSDRDEMQPSRTSQSS